MSDVSRRDPGGTLRREVRLGLVMNGGVSLAIWIGGVTHELDCLRRAAGAPDSELAVRPTSRCYKDLLAKLRQRVLVDVVAGASAGGINGGLLAAAVYSEIPLPPLREIWITLGDFTTLLRSPSRREPPSLLRGDDVVLPQLRRTFEGILSAARSGPSDPIYLYVTATDFYGTPAVFADSGNRRFQESDHRKVFLFEHPVAPGHEIEAEAIAKVNDRVEGAMPDVATFEHPNAAELLARAARSSSSFPVAFEAHGMKLEDGKQHWMIDGGVLDNQPFNPVLNRIATIDAGDIPIRRVVGYIVPYVTVPKGWPDDSAAKQPTALETSSAASSLPRDLPKLDGLRRITHELSDGRRAHMSRKRFATFAEGAFADATAAALFDAYRRTLYDDSLETFASWDSEQFRPGAGEIGQLETLDPRESLVGPIASSPEVVQDGLLWVPDADGRVWTPGTPWRWGLSPSERIAAEALSSLRKLLFNNPDRTEIATAKGFASGLVQTIRAMKFLASAEFQKTKGNGTVLQRATAVYTEPVTELTQSFGGLATQLAGIPEAPPLQRLINGEVVRNAFSTDQRAVPPVFDFIHMSAGVRNSLGHQAETPESKLAGMKLGHFAGFLKRSWRANDWLWGRLDGAEYAVSCVLDLDYLSALPDADLDTVSLELRDFAFPADDHAILADCWMRTLNAVRLRPYSDPYVAKAVKLELEDPATSDPLVGFVAVLRNAAVDADPEVRGALLDCCRAALTARIQLQILEEELPEVAAAIEQDLKNGASRGSSGAEWVLRETGSTSGDRVGRFRNLHIGSDEDPQHEASSKLGMEVASSVAAVAAAAFSGSRGGLPAAIRAPLGAIRGLTLVFNILVRLLVRTPAFGIAAVLAATVALVWALTEPNALLTAALPGLAALVIGGATVLIAMATSPLEAPSRSRWQRVGLVGIIVVPLAILVLILALPFGWEFGGRFVGDAPLATGEPASWLSNYTTGTASDLARWFVMAAAVAAVLRLLVGRAGRRFRIVDLWVYRWALLLAAGAVAGGVAYDRVTNSDRSWNGTILILILFGAISLAPLVAELASGGRWAVRRVFSAQSWRTGFLSQSFLETGVWLLLFMLVLPAVIVGCAVAKGIGDSTPTTVTVTVTTAPEGSAP